MEYKRFRLPLHINEKYHFYDVLLFENGEDMRGWHKRQVKRKPLFYRESARGTFDGMVIPWTKERYDKKSDKFVMAPKIGEILLHKKRIGVGVLTHEINHAALNAISLSGSRKVIISDNENMEDQEEFCYLAGDMIEVLVAKLYDYNAYEDRMLCVRES